MSANQISTEGSLILASEWRGKCFFREVLVIFTYSHIVKVSVRKVHLVN